jgi:hypothetical protein
MIPLSRGPGKPLRLVAGDRLATRPRRPLFSDLVKTDHSAITGLGHGPIMATKSKMLSSEEFASLLKVANTNAVLEPPAVIPAEHSARLIEIGYMADLDGRLRMTTVGRYRIATAENQNRRVPKVVNRGGLTPLP